MATAPEALDLPLRRAKLQPPRPVGGLVQRPRLTALLDRALHVPLTLVSAPAGFGKTTLLSEWAAHSTIPLAWLALDAGDRNLKRFVTHIVAVIETLVPGVSAPVFDQLRSPHPVAPTEIGASLADQLLDLSDDIVLILDDYQLAASGEVERFLGGFLQATAPKIHLILATRSDPALPLARMRLHGHVNELRAADLRFSDEEAQALLVAAGHTGEDPALVDVLQQQTGGWIAGLRLATLALPAVEDLSRIAEVIAGEQHLMDFLVEEVLATQEAPTQELLLRTAIVDRVSAPLATALLDRAPPGGSRALLERLAHENLFLEAIDDEGEWFRFHPLFRSLLLHQLELRLSSQEIATLHSRAGAWFATHGQIGLAIQHRVKAGDMTGAVDLVEQHAHSALNREDWPALAGWLELLPEAMIHGRPRLLLAKAWTSHFSGRSVPIRAMLAEIDALLAKTGEDQGAVAAVRAECDALSIAALLSPERDPHAAVAFARNAVARVPAHHRLAAGLASFGLGCALQAIGRTDEAIHWLTALTEQQADRIDAGSIRALGGLMFVHQQAGNLRACEEVARHILTIAKRHELPVATGWAHWMLGGLAYGRNELETASAHFSAIVADYQRVHLHCLCEAMFGLTLAYHARQMPVEAASTLHRFLEIILDANALEYLPLFRGFEARLALMQGDRQRAIDWLEMGDIVAIESNSLDCFDHAYLTRIKVLLAEGSAASLARAWRDVEAMREFTEARHHLAHRIEILALAALVLDAQGQTETALEPLRRSVELSAASGVVRTFVDLGPAIVPLFGRLAEHAAATAHHQRILEATGGRPGPGIGRTAREDSPGTVFRALESLTLRELEVLELLALRLSYKEIGEELFISMHTVKSHAVSIYHKLDVENRRQSLARAKSLGWTPQATPR